MNNLDTMNREYRKIQAKYPESLNPDLDRGSEAREVLVICICHQAYRVMINGVVPIPIAFTDTLAIRIYCPQCGRALQNAVGLAGHSAGVFNAIQFKARA